MNSTIYIPILRQYSLETEKINQGFEWVFMKFLICLLLFDPCKKKTTGAYERGFYEVFFVEKDNGGHETDEENEGFQAKLIQCCTKKKGMGGEFFFARACFF